MPLILYKSNRLEALAEQLADELGRSPLSSPFTTERIVVQTQGMAQWLKLELCQRQGIAANLEFPFPRSFLFELMERVLPESPCPIDPTALTWRIMETLKPLLDNPAFTEIGKYLSNPADERPLFQLADRIANLFDQYSVYRPEMIDRWIKRTETSDPAERWQAELWRHAMTGKLACQGKFLYDLIQALDANKCNQAHLPERLSVFGATSLPPIYLDVLERLGNHIPVHLFWLAPCREYWGDISSPGEAQRIQAGTGDGNSSLADLHLDPGHPLLASWGKTGRDFLKLVVDAEPSDKAEDFRAPGTKNLLGFLQSGILDLADGGASDAGQPYEVRPDDRSVQIHACHSPLRELQVLRDQLLHWFDTDEALSPDDILVILPDVEVYAPFVKGVFDSVEPGAPAIPYTLADRGARQQSPLIDGFVALLRLPGSRLTASSVLALFETAAVRRRFGVDEEDLFQIRQWMQRSGTRWGRNSGHREALGLPAFGEHTWEHSRDRLLLGYALADGTETTFNGTLPCEGVEGTATELLGRWLDFQQQLFAVLDELALPRTLAEWANSLNRALDTLFLPQREEEVAANAIRLANDGLRQEQAASGCEQPIPLPVILERLLPQFDQPPSGKAFLRGTVTFAGLNPMRGIPFRVICLLGMQDGSFPRTPSPLAFDLMAQKPRPGDTSRREDDRYLFLEALLSARDRFYVSYLGQSVRDNSARPPSVVVSELQDYISACCCLQSPTGEAGTKEGGVRRPEIRNPKSESNAECGVRSAEQVLLVTRHGLHPFSPAYFRPGESGSPHLFSFSPANAAIGQALIQRAPQILPPFLEKPLPEAAPELRTVTLKNLQSCYRNPSRFFVTKRLEYRLPEDKDMMEDQEPFALDALAAFKLKQTAVDLLLEKAESRKQKVVSLWKAQGEVPPAAAGTILGNDIITGVMPLVRKVQGHLGGAKKVSLNVNLPIGNFQLEAQLLAYEQVGLVHYRPSKVDPKKKPNPHLDIWLEHLALQLADWPGPKISYLLGEDASWTFPEIQDAARAKDLLAELLDLYWQGLRQPLQFFPRTSLAYAADGTEAALEKALSAWEGIPDSDYQQGEQEDPYFRLCFASHPNPLDEQFQALAKQVFAPLLDNHKKEKE